MSKIRKPLLFLSAIAVMAMSYGYLSHSDTQDAQIELTTAAYNKEDDETLNRQPALESAYSTTHSASTDNPVDTEGDSHSLLISEVMNHFRTMEEILDNMEHPSVQALIASMPAESQTTIAMAALKQSVSKRLDLIEADPSSVIDQSSLSQDIDLLAQNLVMMPDEARNLKAYVQQRIQR